MSAPPSEEQLERRCRAGETGAIAEARELLNSNSAYTRGRASEMLALVPESKLAAILNVEFVRFPDPLWWRVLALFAEAQNRFPGAPFSAQRVLELLSGHPSADPDALFQALRALTAGGVKGRAKAAESLVRHKDREVAFRALLCVAEERPLTPEELALAQAVRGSDRLHALVLRMEQGDMTAGPDLVSMLPRSGPYAYHLLETVERCGDASLFPKLRRIYRRWLSGQHVSARAAGAAAIMGDPEALSRLREFARSWRADVRGVAWAELARSGSEQDMQALRGVIADDRVGPFVIAELWRSDRAEVREWVHEALGFPEPERLIAACEAASHLLPDPRLKTELLRLSESPDPRVAHAAQSALQEAAREESK